MIIYHSTIPTKTEEIYLLSRLVNTRKIVTKVINRAGRNPFFDYVNM